MNNTKVHQRNKVTKDSRIKHFYLCRTMQRTSLQVQPSIHFAQKNANFNQTLMDFPHTWSYIHQRLHILNSIPTCGDTKPTDEAPDWKATGGRTREGSIQKGAFQISRNIASATKSDTATSNIAPATKNNRLDTAKQLVKATCGDQKRTEH